VITVACLKLLCCVFVCSVQCHSRCQEMELGQQFRSGRDGLQSVCHTRSLTRFLGFNTLVHLRFVCDDKQATDHD